MRKIFVLSIIGFLTIGLSGCRKGIDKVLVGTWNVTKVEGVLISGSTSFPPEVDENPIGTITFKANGRGEQNYSFQYNGNAQVFVGSFKWSANDDKVYIERDSESDLEWTRVIDTENRQVATYNHLLTSTESIDYTLTLEK